VGLMQEIRSFPVPRKSVAMWWLGQSGYIFKTAEGTLASVDLYLTDSCANLVPGMNLSRQVPILLKPQETEVDLFICTHSHQDHADPETIGALRNKDTAIFAGPCQACDVFRGRAIEDSRIRTTWPKSELQFRDIHIRGMFALPTDDTDLNHMGFIFQFGGGPRVYVTGDTDFSELLYSAAQYTPDLVITVVNGGFNNLSHWEAADVVGRIKPRAAIPCHYDMFPDNSVDPLQFRSAMRMRAPGVAYQQLEHGKVFVFSREA